MKEHGLNAFRANMLDIKGHMCHVRLSCGT